MGFKRIQITLDSLAPPQQQQLQKYSVNHKPTSHPAVRAHTLNNVVYTTSDAHRTKHMPVHSVPFNGLHRLINRTQCAAARWCWSVWLDGRLMCRFGSRVDASLRKVILEHRLSENGRRIKEFCEHVRVMTFFLDKENIHFSLVKSTALNHNNCCTTSWRPIT